MNYTLKLFLAFTLSSWLIVGCSSSDDNMPDEGTVAGMTDAGTTAGDTTGGNGDIDLNGDYSVEVMLDEGSMAVPECDNIEGGDLTVTMRSISGTVNGFLTVTGTIEADGTISGGFALEDGTAIAAYGGSVQGADLAGTWADNVGCSGTWRAEKVPG